MLNRGKPVGDNDRRPLFNQLLYGELDNAFRFCVNGRSRFIQDKDLRIVHQGADK